MKNHNIFNTLFSVIVKALIALLTVQSANALTMEAFYGKYQFSANETSGFFNDKPLENYHGTLTIESVVPSEKIYADEATAIVTVDGGVYYSARVKVRHGSMMELHYTNQKGQQVVAFCTNISSTAYINNCEGSLSGNMNATTTFSLIKN